MTAAILSPQSGLTSQLFSEAACHREGQKKCPSKGVGTRVLQLLYDEFPNPLQPRLISRLAKAPYPGTKKWLTRNEGLHVVNIGNGFYRAKATWNLLKRIGIEPITVHGIGARIESLRGGSPPQIEGQGTVLPNGDVVAEFHGRRVTMQRTKDGGVWVQCRATTDPLSVPAFAEFSAWLKGLANGRPVKMEQWELSVDPEDHRMRLDGVQAVTLRGFTDHLWKIYNKSVTKATRIESCWHRLDMKPDEAAALLHAVTSRPMELHRPAWNPEVA